MWGLGLSGDWNEIIHMFVVKRNTKMFVVKMIVGKMRMMNNEHVVYGTLQAIIDRMGGLLVRVRVRVWVRVRVRVRVGVRI